MAGPCIVETDDGLFTKLHDSRSRICMWVDVCVGVGKVEEGGIRMLKQERRKQGWISKTVKVGRIEDYSESVIDGYRG